MAQTKQNSPCVCGSGHKFKKCCGRITKNQHQKGVGILDGIFGIEGRKAKKK